MSYNYYEAIEENIDLVVNNYNFDWSQDKDDLLEELSDRLWTDDSVTGNASGSYTFNSWVAKEYVLDNIELLFELAEELSMQEDIAKKISEHEWEYCDVFIRCMLLDEVLTKVIDRLVDEHTKT